MGNLFVYRRRHHQSPDGFYGNGFHVRKNGSPYGYDQQTRRIGATANVNYTYDRRYFVDLTGTVEGSSRFGANNRTAPFWSAGAGWNLHREKFMQGVGAISNARVRLSYGTSGLQNFSPYQALRTYKNYTNVNYSGWNGSYLMALGNDELGWQKTNQVNFGFDLGFFDHRLEINFDTYKKVTDDLLADVTLPSAAGFTSYKANVGKVQNKGFELDLNGHLLRHTASGISWQAGVALRYNKNKIMKISDSLKALNDELLYDEEDAANPSFLFEEGRSINTIYAVRSLGIDPSNGKEIYLKRDGTLTNEWDAADQVACGVDEPSYWGTVSTLFRYKNLSLNAIFAYQWGGQSYNYTLADKVENIRPYQNADKRAYYDRWQQPGDEVLFKAISESSRYGANTTKATSRFVMDDNLFTLKTLKLTYDFDQQWVRDAGLNYFSVSVSTEDVFVSSSIKQERGWNYPYSRKFYTTLTVRF
ncbi:MAG: TonB-dependent receptor [Rikenellaceae bacterium]|nr:TonB-dependent receptor [Rikenellaceae bacterium]